MQDTFRCHWCGAQNLIGEGHCVGCGQLLTYTCPKCGYGINSTFTHCPYCHLALHWPDRQQSRTIYGDPTASRYQSNGMFACSMCGTQNVIGVKLCRKCNQRFNYTCPDCNARVDNTFINCPNCRGALHWPAEKELQGTFAKNSPYEVDEVDFEETGRPTKKGVWPVVVLGVGLLFIITFGFITAIAPSTMTVSNPSAVHALSDVPTTTQQPNNASTALSTANTPASVPVPSPVTAPTGTGAWNTAADSYLQNLDLNWGKPAAPDPTCPLCKP